MELSPEQYEQKKKEFEKFKNFQANLSRVGIYGLFGSILIAVILGLTLQQQNCAWFILIAAPVLLILLFCYMAVDGHTKSLARELGIEFPEPVPVPSIPSSVDPDVIYETKMDFYTFKLYKNRLEVNAYGSTKTILLRNIANINEPLFSMSGLEIFTTDGKKESLHIAGEPAKILKSKILELL